MNTIKDAEEAPQADPFEKATSENGGSTNLSEGSLEQVDEDLKHPQGQKYEFINESYQEWPKWSIKPVETEVNETEKQVDELAAIKIHNFDDDFMYNRALIHEL